VLRSLHGLMSTHTVGLGSHLQHLDCVQTMRLRLVDLVLLHVDDFGLGQCGNPRVQNVDNISLKYLASPPLKSESFALLCGHSLNRPVRLRDKLLDYLGLVNTKSQCGSLAWPVGHHSQSGIRLSQQRLEVLSLESREGNPDLEIHDLSCIH
jgi:hypothetical protein